MKCPGLPVTVLGRPLGTLPGKLAKPLNSQPFQIDGKKALPNFEGEVCLYYLPGLSHQSCSFHFNHHKLEVWEAHILPCL